MRTRSAVRPLVWFPYAANRQDIIMGQERRFAAQASEHDLEHLNRRALEIHMENIRQIKKFAELQPDHPFALANKHVLELSEKTSWNAAGLLSMSGLAWWALNLSVDLSLSSYATFNASGGPDWDIALFTSSVAGYFLVDPSKLSGKYEFQLQSIAGGVGEVSFNLYKSDGAQIASFVGAVVGISVSKVAGKGTFKYHS
jgi:hypothetical protein